MNDRSLGRPIALTFVGEAASLIATVFVTRRVATTYSGAEVAGYLVLRQALNWILSVGLLGMNVSLPRALALTIAEQRPGIRHQRVAAALLLATPVLIAMALVALFAPRLLAAALLHDPTAAPLVTAACFLIGANGLFALAAATLQGIDRFGALAVGRIAVFGVGPVAVTAALDGRGDLALLLWLWGAITLALVGALWWSALRALGRWPPRLGEPLAPTCRALLGYGGPRMVGAIAQLSTVALAPSLALWCGAEPAAAAALSVAAMLGVLLGPVRLALLPIGLTRLSASRDAAEARALAQGYFGAAACASAAAGGFLASGADRLVEMWLGARFSTGGAIIPVAAVAVTLHFFCYTLEGILDAKDPEHARPRAQLLSAALFVVGAGPAFALRAGVVGVVAAQLASSLLQAGLYCRQVRARYGLPAARELVHGAVTVGLGCLVAGLACRSGGHTPAAIARMLVVQAVAALALLALARATGVRWLLLLLPRRHAEDAVAVSTRRG